MFGYDDIYKRLRPFVERWRQLKAQQPAAKVGHGCEGSARYAGGTSLTESASCGRQLKAQQPGAKVGAGVGGV